MEILLPPKKGAVENVKLEFEHLVVVGANGAGKTRFGSWVEEHNYEKVHRISAQKSLSMPSSVCTTSIEIAEEELLYGTHYVDKNWLKQYGRINSRWSNNLNTSLLNDYEKLMILLHSEEYEKDCRIVIVTNKSDIDFLNELVSKYWKESTIVCK